MEQLSQVHEDHVRVAVSISDPLARESAEKAVRGTGGTPIFLPSLADVPAVADVCAGTVCDLYPWNPSAISLFRTVRRTTPHGLFVLYVPEARKSMVVPLDDGDPSVRCCIQDSSPAAEAGLRDALSWLISSGASSTLISIVLEGRPPANPLSIRFLWWAVHAVGQGPRAPIARAADSVGVSTRTLDRQVRASGLPSPIELYRWIKLLAVAWTAERTQTKLGQAGHRFDLNSMRLYQLKHDLLDPELLPVLRVSSNPLGIVVRAFRERCREVGRDTDQL